MRRRDLKNEDLDHIGIKALKALRASDDEIDQIVRSGGLFEPIRSAIRLSQERPSPTFWYFRIRSYALAWSVAGTSLLVALIIGVLAFVGRFDSSQQAAINLSEQISPVGLPPAREEPPVSDYQEPSGPTVVNASRTRQTARQPRRPTRPHIKTRREPTNIEEVGEFQAITYAGDASEIDDAAQIVRVELPRSSLYALGVDLPIENQAATKIKADLLISEDGVMRAVRVVN